MKVYKGDEENRLPGTRNPRNKWQSKLELHHTCFLCGFYDENPETIL